MTPYQNWAQRQHAWHLVRLLGLFNGGSSHEILGLGTAFNVYREQYMAEPEVHTQRLT